MKNWAGGARDAEADFREGEAWRKGLGRTVDLAAAEAAYWRAAKAGHVGAQAELGLLLFAGERQLDALPWITMAAEANEPRAQYILGITLHNGDLLARDPEAARTLLRSAADAGIKPAATALEEIEPADCVACDNALISTNAARTIQAALRRLPARPATIETLARDMLLSMLGERLETLLPAAFTQAVDRLPVGRAAIHPSPLRS